MVEFLHKDIDFFHGTFRKFDRFYPLSHFGTKRAAEEILGFGPTPLYECLDTLRQYKKLGQTDFNNSYVLQPQIINVKLNLKQTYQIIDHCAEHDINYYKTMFLYHIFEEHKLQGIPKFYDTIFQEPFVMKIKSVHNELKSDNLYPINTHKTAVFSADEINRYHLCFQRMIHYWENYGFDGFHYVNNEEDPGSISYVVFRPEHILFNGQSPCEKNKINTVITSFSDNICRLPTEIELAILKCERARRQSQRFKNR